MYLPVHVAGFEASERRDGAYGLGPTHTPPPNVVM